MKPVYAAPALLEEGGGRGFVQTVKARLEDVSRVVLDVKRLGTSAKAAETAIDAAERYLEEASCNPETCSRAPPVFFKKCHHLLRAQREKLAEICGESEEKPCDVTLKRNFAKAAEPEERQSLLRSEAVEVRPAAVERRLAGLLGDYQQINRVYDSIHSALVDQKPTLTLIDRAADTTQAQTVEGAKTLRALPRHTKRWPLLLLVCVFFLLLLLL